MKKNGMLLALLALLMAALPGALAETVTYLNEKGKEQTTTEAIVLDQAWLDKNRNLHSGWYYVPKGTSVEKENNRTTAVYGDVHLILGDGAILKIEDRGIRLVEQASLTIYAQSQSENMGKLIATATEPYYRHYAGINVTRHATLTINGGSIEATGGEVGGAGIGGNGREGEHEDCGTVIINGGIVTARGGALNGVGIGGGSPKEPASPGEPIRGGFGGKVEINGGLVTAIGGGTSGKAIGSGSGTVARDNGTLTLGNRIAVYDDTNANDKQLTGSDDAILKQIIGTFGQNNQIQKVVFETHTGYQIVESDKYALPNGTLSMTASGEFGDFQYLRLDNKKLNTSFYTTAAGSTVAKVNMAGLRLAPDTQYTLSFIYPDGSADGEFTVVLQTDLSQLPRTGDSSQLLLYVGLALVCGVGVIALLIARKKR